MYIQPSSRLVFIGDSITDCGRKRPIGEGGFDQALGNGFVSLVDAALITVYPDYEIKTINMGVAGNTIRDLKARWESDVLELKPDWLVINIGINDVWQRFSRSRQINEHISVEEYAHTLNYLIQRVRPNLHGLVVMTPYFLEPNLDEPMRALMDQFGGAAGEIAFQQQALLVNTQAAFDNLLEWMHPMHLAGDRIHVNMSGHMVLARAFLHIIGYKWDRSPVSKSNVN